MPYRSILLPVDVAHPEAASAMFETARALLADGGTIKVVYVMPDIPAYVMAEMEDGVMPGAVGKSEQVLRGLVAKSGVEAEVEILTGQAPRAILAAAEGQGADLVIVSSHRPGLADYLLGSTAARIVRHAQCSVLVIR